MFDPYVFGVETQMGRPGVISGADELDRETGLPGPPRAYDVTCPGCGRQVIAVPQRPYMVLTPDGRTVPGDEPWPFRGPRDRFSCRRPIHFRACCGWFGWLVRGVWVGR